MYTIEYHPKIIDDISRIPTTFKKDIRKAIQEKLTQAPEFFGKPLQFSLKGARSMRVGDYRVVFTLFKDNVRIIIIGHRKEVYDDAHKRI